MVKALKQDALLALLDQVDLEHRKAESLPILQQALQSQHSIAIARAAKHVAQSNLHSLKPELAIALARLLEQGAKDVPFRSGGRATGCPGDRPAPQQSIRRLGHRAIDRLPKERILDRAKERATEAASCSRISKKTDG